MRRPLIPTLTILTLMFASTAALALDPVNSTWRGIAIDGYDPVAYFEQGAPTKGDSAITHKWNGATWRFATEANRDSFVGAPEMYAPQYGGYCAWAVSQNSTAGIDPEAWRIVDGKLYLNYSKKIQAKWEADIPGHIAAADRNWPGLVGEN